jgi:hypothetical protein
VSRAQHQFVADHLRNWFETIDQTPRPAAIVARLEKLVNFKEWYEVMQVNYRKNGGNFTLDFGHTKDKKLAMRLALFRAISRNELNAAEVGFQWTNTGEKNINATARNLIQQIFMPMARELRRLFEAELNSPATAPAADRDVSLNHNSQGYLETIEAADEVEKALRETNDFPDQEERQQRIAEVSAVRRLLQAIRIRIEPVVTLLKPLVEQARTKLKDTLVGMAVSKLIGLLGALLSYVWSVL